FMKKFLSSNFSQDIIISKYISNDYIDNFANLSGKPYFPNEALSEISKMDIDGNIYIIPYKSTKRYLFVNKKYFEINNITIPKDYNELLFNLNNYSYLDNLIYFRFNDYNYLGTDLFNFSFSLTDGLSISGYKWAKDLENGNASVYDLDLTNTFNFLDQYNSLFLKQYETNNFDINKAVDKFIKNEIGIIELKVEELSLIENYYNEDIQAIPFYSALSKENYILENNHLYLAVNKNSMKNKKEIIDLLLEEIVGKKGFTTIVNDNHSIYEPLINITSSTFDKQYISNINNNQNKITNYYDFNRGEEFLSYAVYKYLNGEFDRDQFLDYWQQDVLVSQFNLNDVSIAKTETDLTSRDCSIILAKSIKSSIECDASFVTYIDEINELDKLSTMYSSIPIFIDMGDIYVKDIFNMLPYNINKEIINSNHQQIITYEFTKDEILQLIENHKSDIILYGIKKINGEIYLINDNGELKKIDDSKKYKLCTNSNNNLVEIQNKEFYISDIKIKDIVIKWVIDNSPLSSISLNSFKINAK
ncbi:MAG: hypothetical protein PQJ44_00065, partial [Sphaerochaetaceae bacterium]|nr:hypothetical protein [Sphaerochaetaceae bacterium]